MSERKIVRNYLLTLRGYLSPLSNTEAEDVVREIESHIYDVIDDEEMKGQNADIESVLERLGPPRALAEEYVSHLQSGTPLPKGFRALRRVSQSVSVTSYYTLLIMGYGVGIFLGVLACTNLFLADGIAIWSEAGGNTIVIGLAEEIKHSNASKAITGLWISPLALVGSYFSFRMTHRVLKFIKETSQEQTNA